MLSSPRCAQGGKIIGERAAPEPAGIIRSGDFLSIFPS